MKILFLFLGGFVSIVIMLLEYHFINGSLAYTHYLEFQLFLIYWLCLFCSVRKFGIFHLYSLYLLTFGLFGLYKIFFDFLFDIDFRETFAIVDIQLDEIVVQKMILVYTIYLLALHFTFLSICKVRNNNCCFLKQDTSLFILGKRVMLFFYPFTLLRAFFEIRYILQSGISIYILGSSADVPYLVKIFECFYQCGYLIFLASYPNKKDYFLFSSLYFIGDLPYLILGQRFTIVVDLLFMMFYYFKMYNVNIKLKKLIVPGLVLIIILQLIALTRRGNEIGDVTIWQMIPLFLSAQSTSMYVLPLYMQNMNISHSYPFLLDPLAIFFIHASGQSLETLDVRSSLGHQLIYELNPTIYLNGNSLGTTQIAELFEFGILGIIIGAMVYAYFIKMVDFKMTLSKNWRFASFVLISSILAAPRSTYLPNLYMLAKMLLVYLVIIYFIKPIFIRR